MDLSKLPKWAQEHIATLERERDVAIRELNEWVDSQTPSPIYIDEMVCTGETKGTTTKRRYVQTRRLTIEYAGVELDVFLAPEHDGSRDFGIHLSFSTPDHSLGQVAMIPISFQQVVLIAKENMR